MKYLRYRHLFRMYEFIQPFINYSVPLEESLKGGRVLVVAPHEDDESIGCGGTIIKHINAGGYAEIAFCTHDTPERMKEAEKAVSALGVKRSHFLQFPLRSLDGNRKFEDNLAFLLHRTKPEIVFLPFWLDKHEDHRAVSKALIKIKKRISMNFMIYAYSVWAPLNPNVVFDISEEWELKKRAIKCYKTQLASRDYVKMAQGLNQYWGEIKSSGMQYGEAFFKATAAEYISLGKKIFR
ncbi:MAG: PIG-L family deacetylase [Endomicrobia bacterium]|nr:PIG-L family deacetylase [Endomicrobiia bacterium]MCL2799444.1 PIG-L family deacetylase [Endomicrobiia bacterium]